MTHFFTLSQIALHFRVFDSDRLAENSKTQIIIGDIVEFTQRFKNTNDIRENHQAKM